MNTHQPAICINSVQIGFKYPHHRTNKVYECEHLKSRNTTPVSYDGKWWWSVNIWNETNETIVYIGQLQWITLIRSEFHLVLNVLSCAWWHTDTCDLTNVCRGKSLNTAQLCSVMHGHMANSVYSRRSHSPKPSNCAIKHVIKTADESIQEVMRNKYFSLSVLLCSLHSKLAS